ncbi:MAG: hypothetical protein JWP89_5191 [Schlesneria sp.]|nr:hypothetical protein [Schlesneria sp.]
MSDKDRSVFHTPQGWANKCDGNQQVTSYHETQRQAHDAAHQNLANQGGGELKVMGLDGQIRQKDTIAPAKDPRNTPG